MKRIFLLITIFISSLGQAQEVNPSISVRVIGRGSPVLLIPGFTVPGESWDTTVRQLEKNHECHVVTLAGFGGMEPIEFPWLPKINEALEDYIYSNQLANVTVIGHSLGGTIATWLASRDNNLIAKIIVVDALPATGALMFPNFNPDSIAYQSPYNDRLLAMSEVDFANMAAGMSQGMSLNSETREKIKNWTIQADRKTYVYGYTDYLKLDVRENLKNITIPVIVIAADMPYGKEVVGQTYRGQYANLIDYELIIVENSAHFVMFDQQEWFIDQIQKILASH